MTKIAAIIIVTLIATPAMAQHSVDTYTIDQMELDKSRAQLNYQRFENYQLQQELERERALRDEREFQRAFPPPLDWDRCGKDIRYC